MKDEKDRPVRRRLGRPPKTRDEVRSKRVVSFITRGEIDTLSDLADIRGESVSTVVHQILRSALGKEKNRILVSRKKKTSTLSKRRMT